VNPADFRNWNKADLNICAPPQDARPVRFTPCAERRDERSNCDRKTPVGSVGRSFSCGERRDRRHVRRQERAPRVEYRICRTSPARQVPTAEAIFRHACQLGGIDGIVSKGRDRPYCSGRSPHWLKVLCPRLRAARQYPRLRAPPLGQHHERDQRRSDVQRHDHSDQSSTPRHVHRGRSVADGWLG
jgi:hypothetical protein